MTTLGDNKLVAKRCYLVTGGTGFLGSHLLPLLVSRGAYVVCYARSLPAISEQVAGVEYYISKRSKIPRTGVAPAHGGGDGGGGIVDDIESLMDAATSCVRGGGAVRLDGIFHLAGVVAHTRLPEHAAKVYRTNVEGTMNVLKVAQHARGCPRVVIASTSGVIACSRGTSSSSSSSSSKRGRSDEDEYCINLAQHWPYYHSKIIAEQRALSFAKANGIEVIFMRPSVMLGPGDNRFRSTSFICSYLLGKLPVVPPGTYSFVDVRDAAQAFVMAMTRERGGGGGGGGRGYLLSALSLPTSELFARLEALSGVPAPKLKLGRYALKAVSVVLDAYHRKVRGVWDSAVDPVRAEMGACDWAVDASRAMKELAFVPRDPNETLRDTIEYARRHHPLLRDRNTTLDTKMNRSGPPALPRAKL